ncbi:unnamed protein product [Brassica napus]|uniref:(rape) hypothetical protein n=1 Tax=Brassica napus TaxID=3708 RepID=A0A816HZX5_BRANA|nr:unnamed protein product [Brassica napus]
MKNIFFQIRSPLYHPSQYSNFCPKSKHTSRSVDSFSHCNWNSFISFLKMGFLSQQISRDELKPGDHIYSWRRAYIYSHHGIYVGNGDVIHFTCGGGLETRTGTFVDNVIVSSVPNHGGDNPCPNCGDQSNLNGVISSCLDCFLAGGNLYLFEYGVSGPIFMAKPRGGICTTAVSDSSDETVHRARYLLSKKNGFGAYDLLKNNCEDFAIYCKTGLIVLSKLGSSGQANSWSAARWLFRGLLVLVLWLWRGMVTTVMVVCVLILV